VASTAVLESHIALQTGKLYTLSPQELVSCVQNPEHCGGGGGCTGATYELAFDYVQEYGMVTEAEFPYQSNKGANVKCSLVNDTAAVASLLLLRGSTSTITAEKEDYIEGAVASIQGYINFPNNNYTALMNAVATLGPIGVTVAASSWAFYGGGIFEPKSHNSSAATGVDHAVVLEGYGVDQETQEPYWLVRNSWGTMWGEGGYIRLKRVDPSTLDDFDKDDCGMDLDPADGAACTKDKNGHDIVPKPVKVCGTSAILYDTFVPVGGHLISKKTSSVAMG
jgi:cathepsin L